MALMNPNSGTSSVLKAAGIVKSRAASEERNNLKEILNDNNLSLEETIRELSTTIRDSRDEHLRLRGIDTALKLHKVLEDPEAAKMPQITIVIQSPGPEGAASGALHNESSIPSICLPRENVIEISSV